MAAIGRPRGAIRQRGRSFQGIVYTGLHPLTGRSSTFYPAFGDEPIGHVTVQLLESCDGRPVVEHQVEGEHECRVVKHRRRPGRPPVAGYPAHDCAESGCVVVECQPHICVPLAPATIRCIHFTMRGVLTAAERWAGSLSHNRA